MFMFKKSLEMPRASDALPGRASPIPTASDHFVNGRPLKPPFPDGLETAIFGLGCFWGAERKFWELGDGVYVTAVGYAGGHTPNPTYQEVCTGRTGHNEVVLDRPTWLVLGAMGTVLVLLGRKKARLIGYARD